MEVKIRALIQMVTRHVHFRAAFVVLLYRENFRPNQPREKRTRLFTLDDGLRHRLTCLVKDELQL